MKMRPLLLLLCCSLPFSVSAQSMIEGKIFSSPEERQYLDYLRKEYLTKSKQTGFNIEDSQVPEIPGSGPGAPQGPVEYSFDAIMARGDGRFTIWLNHQSMTEQQLPADFHLVREGNSLALKVVTSNGRTQLVRPGQTIDVTSGVVQEHLHRPAPAATKPQTDDTATTEPAAEPKKEATKTVAGTADETANAADTASTQNPQSLIDSLPAAVRKNVKTVESLIQSLETLRDGIDEDKDK